MPTQTYATIAPGQFFFLPTEQTLYRRPCRGEMLVDPQATCYTTGFDAHGNITRIVDYIAPDDLVLPAKARQ